jgi:hypothetical protein
MRYYTDFYRFMDVDKYLDDMETAGVIHSWSDALITGDLEDDYPEEAPGICSNDLTDSDRCTIASIQEDKERAGLTSDNKHLISNIHKKHIQALLQYPKEDLPLLLVNTENAIEKMNWLDADLPLFMRVLLREGVGVFHAMLATNPGARREWSNFYKGMIRHLLS